MVVQRDLTIVPDTRAFSREVTSIDHPVLSTVKRPRGADAQGVFVADRKLEVLLSEALGEGWLASAFLVQSVPVQR